MGGVPSTPAREDPSRTRRPRERRRSYGRCPRAGSGPTGIEARRAARARATGRGSPSSGERLLRLRPDSGMSVRCPPFRPHHPTTPQTLGIRSMFAVARVAAPTVEAGRNVSSSPVSEAVSEVRPPGGGFCVPGIAPWRGASPTSRSARRTSVTYRTAPRGATSTAATPLAYSTTSRSPCRQRRHPRGLRQRGDDMVDGLSFATRIAILVGDINVVTADEPDTKHDRFHVPHPTTPRRRPPGFSGLPGLPHPRWAESAQRRSGFRSVRNVSLGTATAWRASPTQRHGVTVPVGVFDPVWDPLGLLARAAASPGHELAPFGSHSVCHDPHDRT